jgi:hypothetical protein
MTRFCPSCHTEVEARDGFCLLGHPLRLEAPTSSISELRAEVDKAFEDARAEIATVLITEVPGMPVQVGAVTQPPVAPAAPPPPPPPASRFESVWQEQEAAQTETSSDPIIAFAPPPRMDWGPRKEKRKIRFGRSRTAELA